ncbi:hypothetical protein ED733_002686 [Metarhizium rileyi]|uniref:Chitin binding protein n=1 Tax=Metarhizium rileyi (strain RCEF 4871) TaxID=1649241 RepID=A0A5C6G5T3_METRR|nr:hypothetical protein ED733_002686 [Metarhizium rileyi]
MKTCAIVVAAAQAASAISLAVQGRQSNYERKREVEHPTVGTIASRQGSRCGIGQGEGRCEKGYCCSKEGWCGRGYEYCSSPACQVDFSDSCDGNVRPDGPGTEDVDRRQRGSLPYGSAIYHCEKYGAIALSYDDGPFKYTADLLDLLKRYEAKATFFITGRNLGKGAINDPKLPWRNLIKRMVDDGHQIGSHSWSHQRLPDMSDSQLDHQIIYNEIAIADILGYFPTYFRPPYSASNAKVDRRLGELGYHVTYFNLDTEGYLHDTPGDIQVSKDIWDRNVEGKDPRTTKWLDIEHDTVYQSVYNLTEYMLKSLFRNGFKSVTVGECLGDAKENWYRSVGDGKKHVVKRFWHGVLSRMMWATRQNGSVS